MNTKVTRVQARANTINTFITDNRNVFAQGNTFKADWLAETFSLSLPANPTPKHFVEYNLRLVGLYTKVNKLLAKRGLYIKAKDYYSEFEVLDSPKTMEKISNYQHKSQGNSKAATNLTKGFKKHKGKWRKLGKREVEELSKYL